MARRLEDSVIKEIKRLFFEEEIPIREISGRLNRSITTVYSYTQYLENGFETPGEYSEFLARRKGHVGYVEYKGHLSTEKRGFSSNSEYEKYLLLRKECIKKISPLKLKSNRVIYQGNIREVVFLVASQYFEIGKEHSVGERFSKQIRNVKSKTKIKASVDVKEDRNNLLLIPENLESRAFLDALVISSGLTKRIQYLEAA